MSVCCCDLPWCFISDGFAVAIKGREPPLRKQACAYTNTSTAGGGNDMYDVSDVM